MNTPISAAGAFPSTQWSIIVRAGNDHSDEAHAALEHLCRMYWYPLYAFARRQGRAHHEAEDSTQQFFFRFLAVAGIARARKNQGRFRTFLLTSFRNFLTNEWQRASAAKRGGGVMPLSLQLKNAEGRFAQEPAASGLTPEQAFDLNWAVNLIDRTVAGLREEYETTNRSALFAALLPLLWGNETDSSLAEHAVRHGLKEQAFSVALHRLRRRVGERLRAHVTETVADPTEIDAELRHLVASITAR